MQSTAIFIIGVIVGLFGYVAFVWVAGRFVGFNSQEKLDSIIEESPKHIAPNAKYYTPGKFVEVNQCTGCKSIFHWMDQPLLRPCQLCSSQVKHIGIARWIEKDGYWQPKNPLSQIPKPITHP